MNTNNNNTTWKKHLTLVQCTQPDTPPSTPEDFDNIRKWVDRAIDKIVTAVERDLKDVHEVRGMHNEHLLLKECINDGVALIKDATHLLETLSSELKQ